MAINCRRRICIELILIISHYGVSVWASLRECVCVCVVRVTADNQSLLLCNRSRFASKRAMPSTQLPKLRVKGIFNETSFYRPNDRPSFAAKQKQIIDYNAVVRE